MSNLAAVERTRQRRVERKVNPYQESGQCRRCGVLLSELNWLLYDYTNMEMICEFCRRASNAQQYSKRKSWLATKMRLWNYGITLDELAELEDKHNGLCAICDKPQSDISRNKQLCIDHNHQTGKVRGLLCDNCNRGIGLLGDNPELLQKAVNYLKEGELSATKAK